MDRDNLSLCVMLGVIVIVGIVFALVNLRRDLRATNEMVRICMFGDDQEPPDSPRFLQN